MRQILTKWLRSGDEKVTLSENHDNIVLQRHNHCLLVKVQLHPSPSSSQLQMWMRLGGSSLTYFEGTLSMDTHGTLWLIQCLHKKLEQVPLEHCLEALLNQRDTWRAVISRLSASKNFTPTSLRTIPY
ncbi:MULTISPECIES: type III secretion protein [Pseudomonas]|uniref:Type III secretion protein n=1 Tax=Pseudomonas khavaziana TaxID=2842351 RepID=A0ABZ2DJB4_9PSED|nr:MULTISPECIES: type III secretion protein [Pseudomonas fluorescens group]